MGHIPLKESTKIDILTFNEALEIKEKIDYDINKWIYIPSFYSEYRYILGTRGSNPLITIGINPSTAKPNDLDNTLKSVERLALSNNFDSFIMFNVYAQRATKPSDMDIIFNKELHLENMKAFRYILSMSKNPTIWAAWGTIIKTRPYLKECVLDMIKIGKEYNARWVCIGKKSKEGHPHHPLYLKKDSLIEDFDIENYINSL